MRHLHTLSEAQATHDLTDGELLERFRVSRAQWMRLFRRSRAEHRAEGFAPRHLDSEIVALGRPGGAITVGQFTGEDAPPPSYFDGLIPAMCRKWEEDGKPKAIVRVPPMRDGSGLTMRSPLGQ